jgi:hypothetical protein
VFDCNSEQVFVSRKKGQGQNPTKRAIEERTSAARNQVVGPMRVSEETQVESVVLGT